MKIAASRVAGAKKTTAAWRSEKRRGTSRRRGASTMAASLTVILRPLVGDQLR